MAELDRQLEVNATCLDPAPRDDVERGRTRIEPHDSTTVVPDEMPEEAARAASDVAEAELLERADPPADHFESRLESRLVPPVAIFESSEALVVLPWHLPGGAHLVIYPTPLDATSV